VTYFRSELASSRSQRGHLREHTITSLPAAGRAAERKSLSAGGRDRAYALDGVAYVNGNGLCLAFEPGRLWVLLRLGYSSIRAANSNLITRATSLGLREPPSPSMELGEAPTS
jgi:hypothetical protein